MTKIEWTDEAWNPVTGCTKVSAGCKNCYAERMATRLAGRCGYPAEQPFAVTLHPDRLDQPLHWRKPRRVFVNSMSDLFHEDVPDEFIDRVFAVMGHCADGWYHCLSRNCDHCLCDESSLSQMGPITFQILTKRPARMAAYLAAIDLRDRVIDAWHELGWYFEDPPIESVSWPLKGVWLGVSVEDQATADERIPLLLETPAAVRFVSFEPILGPVNFRWFPAWRRADGTATALRSDAVGTWRRDSTDELDGLRCLDWLIVGGESGPRARPCDVEWIRSAVKQCQDAGVPVFVKQLGARPVMGRDEALRMLEVGARMIEWDDSGERISGCVTFRNRKGGDPAEWPADLRVREFPR